jgi:hypothetical protein
MLGVLQTVKEHATGVALRADPGAAGYAAGLRPGGMLATVAGCVALSGGAAYCALEGVPAAFQLRGQQTQPEDAPRPRAKRTPVVRASATPAPTAQPARPQPTATPAPRARKRSAPKDKAQDDAPRVSAPAAVDAEFGVEAAVEPAAPAPSAASAPPPQPPGEFDP